MYLVEMALADLAESETFPHDALATLHEKWVFARQPLLDALIAYASGADRSQRNADRVFFGLHLSAEKRETAAFSPLASIMLEGKSLEELLGDATTANLPQILIGLYDGDLAKLKKIIEAPAADEWARVAALDCFAYLAASGEVAMEEARIFLRQCFETLQPRDGNVVWYGWQRAVAFLGFSDLEPLAARAFRQGLVDNTILSFEDFQDDLRAARVAENRLAFLAEQRIAPLDDAIKALALFDHERSEEEAPEPEHNPFRNVGRNDPCPCGSGKKYKKCCLGAE